MVMVVLDLILEIVGCYSSLEVWLGGVGSFNCGVCRLLLLFCVRFLV